MALELVLFVASFALLAPLGRWTVQQLLAHGIGKRIRSEEPDAHQIKAGTATMGGILFVGGAAIVSIGLALAGRPKTLLPLVAMIPFGLLGAYDDLQGLRDRAAVGWLARSKFLWQWVLAFAVALVLYWVADEHALRIPGTDLSYELGAWSILISTTLIVAMSNAVNLTDGMDGLAAGTSAIAYAAFGALAAFIGASELSGFCFILVGALFAFLWYNSHPARVFMGDLGSQALGAGLAVVAGLSGYWLLLPLIGAVFALEALSVIAQVGYFKYNRIRHGEGKRIFRMAPLHYHYELGGWSETQVVTRLWLLAAAAATLGVALGIMRA